MEYSCAGDKHSQYCREVGKELVNRMNPDSGLQSVLWSGSGIVDGSLSPWTAFPIRKMMVLCRTCEVLCSSNSIALIFKVITFMTELEVVRLEVA